MNALKTNPVPINFIYVQLSGQPDPKVLWPTVAEWKDITPEYAGLFFRAEGAGSAKFGELQPESITKLIRVEEVMKKAGCSNCAKPMVPNACTEEILTGGSTGDPISLKFCSSAGEVTPKNKAMHIWKRTK